MKYAYFCCALALVLGLACSDSTDNSFDELSDEEQRDFLAVLGRVQKSGGLHLLAPTYLPDGLSWVPQPTYENKPSPYVTLTFHSIRSQIEPMPGEQAPYVGYAVIRQYYDPEGAFCPPCPSEDPPDTAQFSLRGRPAAAKETRVNELENVQSIYFREGELNVTLKLNWVFPKGAPMELPGSIGREGLKVAESMLGP